MSLFQAREWWSCAPDSAGDEYDVGCMVVANVDNAVDGDDKVVTGSFGGTLRVWYPRTKRLSPAEAVEDLLLEVATGAPILGLCVGHFSTSHPGLALAVLHPHKLHVCAVVSGGGVASGGALFHRCVKLYDHVFATTVGPHFTPANMACGPFGGGAHASTATGVSTHAAVDGIAVQSMDGQVAVFEQDRFLFRRNLNAHAHTHTSGGGGGGGTTAAGDGLTSVQPSNYLLPGPLVYVPRTDSFVTMTCDHKVESFRYAALAGAWASDKHAPAAGATAATSSSGGGGGGGGRHLRPDWSVNLGDHGVHMAVGRLHGGGGKATGGGTRHTDIVVAGERGLYALRDADAGHAAGAAGHATTEGAGAVSGGGGESILAALGASSTFTAPASSSGPGGGLGAGAATSAGGGGGGGGVAGALGYGAGSSHSLLRLQRKLDYTPSAMCVYSRAPATASASQPYVLMPDLHPHTAGVPASAGDHTTPTSPTHGLLIASHAGVLHMYVEEALVWAARLPDSQTKTVVPAVGGSGVQGPRAVPVAVGVGRFGGVSGLIVALSSRGDVSVVYMGTEPPTGVLPAGAGGEGVRDLDYAAMDKEHRALLARIREVQARASGRGASMHGVSAAGVEGLVLHPMMPSTLNGTLSAAGGGSSGAGLLGVRMHASHMEKEGGGDTEDEDGEACRFAEFEGEGEAGAGAPTSSSSLPRPTLVLRVWLSYIPVAGATPLGMASPDGVGTPGPQPAATEVRLTLQPPGWVRVEKGKRTMHVAAVPATSGPAPPAGHLLRVALRCSDTGMPSGCDNTLRIAASYVTDKGDTRVVNVAVPMPLWLAATVIPPVKTATYKLTLDTNRPAAPSLLDLFPDCVTQPTTVIPPDALHRIRTTGHGVLSFAYHCGGDATILASKASGRYRIQAGSLEALSLITRHLASRLTAWYGPGGGAGEGGTTSPLPPFAIAYTEPLPLADFFGVMEDHFALRRRLVAAYSSLNDRAHEYRLITKRLLVRWRDQTPTSLHGLDKLADVAQAHVQHAGGEVNDAMVALAAANNRLSCVLSLLALLITYRFGLDPLSTQALDHILCTHGVVDTLEQGWEEMASATLVHALKTLANKVAGVAGAGSGGGDGEDPALAAPTGQTLSLPPDTASLKRYMTMLLDQLTKVPPTFLGEQLGAGRPGPPPPVGVGGATDAATATAATATAP